MHISALDQNPELAAQHKAMLERRARMEAAAKKAPGAKPMMLAAPKRRPLAPLPQIAVTKGRTIYPVPIGPMRFIFTGPIEEIEAHQIWTAELLGPHVPEGAKIPWSELVRYISMKHRRTWLEISSARRDTNLVLARQELWYLAKRHTDLSYPIMARLTGGKDHTSALWGARRYQQFIDVGFVTLWGPVPKFSLLPPIADLRRRAP